MKHVIVGILVWLFVKQTSAQQGRISLDLRATPEKAIYQVSLKKLIDSSLVKMEVWQKEKVHFENMPFGSYFIEVSWMNRPVKIIPAISLDRPELDLGIVEVTNNAQELREIKIQAVKPVLERKFDKLVYNVENTQTAASDDALHVLQKSPGISVDQNGNISMRGKSGVMVMINGKQSYVQGEQLANLLKSTMASQISKIEIITNPSSKYDANGNAGIVNIILKKDQRMGTNGSATLSYGKGYYRKSNNNLQLNHRSRKVNVFGNYNFVSNTGFNDLKLYRKFYTNGRYEGAYQQHNYIVFPFMNHIAKAGVDYTPGKNTIIGLVVSGNRNTFKPHGENKTFVEDSSYTRRSYYTTENKSDDLWYNFGANLNLKHTFDTLGRELSVDADYIRFGNTTTQHFTTRYYDMLSVENKAPYLLLGDIRGQLDIKAIKADYAHPFRNQSKLEAGYKSSFVKADNELAFYNESAGVPVFDSAQSNHFIYKENINALYSNYSFRLAGLDIQAGLRAEQTVADGLQVINGSTFHRNYWQLFPSLFLNRKFNEKHEAGISFSRRIQRPTYEQLNPFKFFLDPSTYKEGNPYLVPQNTYLFELNHSYKQQFTTSLSAAVTNKSITEVLIPAEGQSNITIQTNKNLNRQYVYSLGISAPVRITKWWNTMSDVSVYRSQYDGILSNQVIHSATVSFNAKTMHTFNLPKNITVQADGFIQGAERYSFSTLSTFGMLNLSVQKSFFNKKLNAKLSANDILYTGRFRGSSHFNNYHEDFQVQRDSRHVIVALTYRFGNSGVAPSRRRGGGAEEEKQRAGKNA